MLPSVARPNGQIVYPVVGEVYAHQMISPQEVKDEITQGYYRGIAPKPPQNVKNWKEVQLYQMIWFSYISRGGFTVVQVSLFCLQVER